MPFLWSESEKKNHHNNKKESMMMMMQAQQQYHQQRFAPCARNEKKNAVRCVLMWDFFIL